MTSTRANTELKFVLGQPLNEFFKSDLPTAKDVAYYDVTVMK